MTTSLFRYIPYKKNFIVLFLYCRLNVYYFYLNFCSEYIGKHASALSVPITVFNEFATFKSCFWREQKCHRLVIFSREWLEAATSVVLYENYSFGRKTKFRFKTLIKTKI